MHKVLLADDDAVNIKILKNLLIKWGYDVVCVPDGTAALSQLTGAEPPAIAVLDWQMPGLTGIEVCKHHADSSDAKYIYKIITSSYLERDHIVEALHSGAHDVILKPLSVDLFKMRLAVAAKSVEDKLILDNIQNVTKRYAEQMEKVAQERAQQLVHAERMSSLGVLSAGIAHEINNPMSFIAGNAQSLRRFWVDLEPVLKGAMKPEDPNNTKIAFILEELPTMLDSIMNGVTRVTKIVQSLKKYSTKKITETTQINLNSSIEQAIEISRHALSKQTKVNLLLGKPAIIRGNSVEVEQVLINIIVNAAQAMENSPRPELTIQSSVNDDFVIVNIEDTGPGIPDSILSKIWDPFFSTKPVGQGTGLGLSISAGIIRDHHGRITVANKPDGGARFTIKLPLVNYQASEDRV